MRKNCQQDQTFLFCEYFSSVPAESGGKLSGEGLVRAWPLTGMRLSTLRDSNSRYKDTVFLFQTPLYSDGSKSMNKKHRTNPIRPTH